MKKNLIQIFIFSSPILLTWLIIFLINPYNFYDIPGIVDNNSKLKIINRSYEVQMRGNVLWKIFEFRRKPCKNIIIGDSQSYHMNEELITDLTGNKFYNLSIPGANMETKFNIFWFAIAQSKLDNVIIQLSFPNLVINPKKNLFQFAKDNMDKPYQYLFNSATIIDTYQNIKFKITKNFQTEISPFSFPLTTSISKSFVSSLDGMYINYLYNTNYIDELRKIVTYCKSKDIKIEFLILPMYYEYYNYLTTHNLMRFYDQFISNITALGTTYDYSRDSNIIYNEKNFRDFFHQNQCITDSITRLIWKKK
ncbi:hypothetical protein AQPE_4753 [Aquipluma nitroreducens]|uniref:Uncharacterized protein n=1 Tax=Aquipluma nitroreducens TaxID=2010828 RepID=A0A5K7SGF6_9BACT|nr:hypothetical protein AQPE_4753 [Aquipluma nitroreducens]